jgi:hypothetical protein
MYGGELFFAHFHILKTYAFDNRIYELDSDLKYKLLLPL